MSLNLSLLKLPLMIQKNCKSVLEVLWRNFCKVGIPILFLSSSIEGGFIDKQPSTTVINRCADLTYKPVNSQLDPTSITSYYYIWTSDDDRFVLNKEGYLPKMYKIGYTNSPKVMEGRYAKEIKAFEEKVRITTIKKEVDELNKKINALLKNHKPKRSKPHLNLQAEFDKNASDKDKQALHELRGQRDSLSERITELSAGFDTSIHPVGIIKCKTNNLAREDREVFGKVIERCMDMCMGMSLSEHHVDPIRTYKTNKHPNDNIPAVFKRHPINRKDKDWLDAGHTEVFEVPNTTSENNLPTFLLNWYRNKCGYHCDLCGLGGLYRMLCKNEDNSHVANDAEEKKE